ncbi:hypothetical protein MBAV_004910, partial [Candidatus Magnetobacterium bavaricum]
MFPERKDLDIWPLEKLIPGRIIIPIAEVVAETLPKYKSCGNELIDIAAMGSTIQRSMFRQWIHINRDLNILNISSKLLGGNNILLCVVIGFVMMLFPAYTLYLIYLY